MQILLTDVILNEPEEFDIGTCEMCYGTVNLEISEYEFTYPDGKTNVVENIAWEWGDFYELQNESLIENLPAFAAWLKELDFKDGVTVTFFLLDSLMAAFAENDNIYIEEYLND